VGNETKGCLFLLATFVGLFAVLGLVGFLNSRGHHNTGPATFRAGNCVRHATSQEAATQPPQITGPGTYVAATYCTDKSAIAKIAKIAGTAQRVSGCAHGTRPFAKKARGVPEAAVDDISPDRDWSLSYPQVFCLSKSTET
jgi:hypothetical protein